MADVIAYLKEDIKKYESPERYAHTLGVFDECAWYAEKMYLSDKEKKTLAVAALLHDVSKELPRESAVALCAENGIKYTESPTLHQDTAAPFIKKVYGDIPEICDEAVLSAVSKHTTGGDDMSICDMVLFTADYTEPTRKYESCAKAREYIHSECEKIRKNDRRSALAVAARGVGLICRMTIDHLKCRGKETDPRTERTLLQMAEWQKE